MFVGRTNRNTCIATLGGAAVWPLVARGQQSERVRRIGVFLARARLRMIGMRGLAAFLQGFVNSPRQQFDIPRACSATGHPVQRSRSISKPTMRSPPESRAS